MKNLKAFNLNIETVVLRFYLMMTVVIVAGFTGFWLAGLFAFPIFLSIMLGVSFNWKARFEKPIAAKKYLLRTSPKEKLTSAM